MSVDYNTTVFLPKTDFPMKAGLPDLEPKLLERWAQIDLFGKQRQQGKGPANGLGMQEWGGQGASGYGKTIW